MKLVPKKTALAGQFLPLSVARMLWKRKALIISGTVVITAASIAYITTLPAVYRSESVLLVDAQKIPEKFVSSTVQQSLQDGLNSISQQVLSTSQLMSIIKDLNLYAKERRTKLDSEILEFMRADLKIKVEKGFADGKSGAFRISYEGPDAVADQKVVSRISDLFIRENLKNREQRAQGTSAFIEDELQDAKRTLDIQEASLSNFKLTHVGELPQQETSLLSTLSRLQMEGQVNQDAINRARQSKSMLETTLRLAENAKGSLDRAMAQQRQMQQAAAAAAANQSNGGPAASVRPPDPLVSERLRTQLDTLKLRYHPTHPEVRRVQAELDQALTAEARAEAARPPVVAGTKEPEPIRVITSPAEINSISTEIRIESERIATTKSQIDVLDQEIQARDKDTGRIQSQIADLQTHVDRLPVREQEMAQLMRDYDNSKANYRSLLDKRISAEMAHHMEEKQQSEGFSIADPPAVPNVPIRPQRRILAMMSVLGGLAFSLLLALALELRNDHVLGEWELPPGIPVLGRIPRVGEGA